MKKIQVEKTCKASIPKLGNISSKSKSIYKKETKKTLSKNRSIENPRNKENIRSTIIFKLLNNILDHLKKKSFNIVIDMVSEIIYQKNKKNLNLNSYIETLLSSKNFQKTENNKLKNNLENNLIKKEVFKIKSISEKKKELKKKSLSKKKKLKNKSILQKKIQPKNVSKKKAQQKNNDSKLENEILLPKNIEVEEICTITSREDTTEKNEETKKKIFRQKSSKIIIKRTLTKLRLSPKKIDPIDISEFSVNKSFDQKNYLFTSIPDSHCLTDKNKHLKSPQFFFFQNQEMYDDQSDFHCFQSERKNSCSNYSFHKKTQKQRSNLYLPQLESEHSIISVTTKQYFNKINKQNVID